MAFVQTSFKRSQFVVEQKKLGDARERRVYWRGSSRVVGIILERDGKGAGYSIKQPWMDNYYALTFPTIRKAVEFLGVKLW